AANRCSTFFRRSSCEYAYMTEPNTARFPIHRAEKRSFTTAGNPISEAVSRSEIDCTRCVRGVVIPNSAARVTVLYLSEESPSERTKARAAALWPSRIRIRARLPPGQIIWLLNANLPIYPDGPCEGVRTGMPDLGPRTSDLRLRTSDFRPRDLRPRISDLGVP